MGDNEKQLFSLCRQTQHLQINSGFPILSCLFLCCETTGWTYMAVHFQMSDLISLRANQHRGFLLSRSLRFYFPNPAFFQHRSLLLENTSDLSATISPSSHQYLISCTGRNLA